MLLFFMQTNVIADSHDRIPIFIRLRSISRLLDGLLEWCRCRLSDATKKTCHVYVIRDSNLYKRYKIENERRRRFD